MALRVAGKLGVTITIRLGSFTAEVTFAKLKDDEVEEVSSIVEKDEVRER